MSQSEVYDFLLKQVEPLTIREIADATNRKVNNVRVALEKLVKYGEVTMIGEKYHPARYKVNIHTIFVCQSTKKVLQQ